MIPSRIPYPTDMRVHTKNSRLHIYIELLYTLEYIEKYGPVLLKRTSPYHYWYLQHPDQKYKPSAPSHTFLNPNLNKMNIMLLNNIWINISLYTDYYTG